MAKKEDKSGARPTRARGKGKRKVHDPRPSTAAQKESFLAEYASCGVLANAADAAGVSRTRHYEWLAKDPAYAKRYREAHARACDRLVREAVRRGLEGWDEPVFGRAFGEYAGTIKVGTIRKYSDRMLELLLKAKLPREFRERLSIGGDPEAPPIQTTEMTPEKAAEIYRAKLRRRA